MNYVVMVNNGALFLYPGMFVSFCCVTTRGYNKIAISSILELSRACTLHTPIAHTVNCTHQLHTESIATLAGDQFMTRRPLALVCTVMAT